MNRNRFAVHVIVVVYIRFLPINRRSRALQFRPDDFVRAATSCGERTSECNSSNSVRHFEVLSSPERRWSLFGVFCVNVTCPRTSFGFILARYFVGVKNS
jgi:hypothetical protein